MAKKTKAKSKKTVKKVIKLSRQDLIAEAIKDFKQDNSDWKKMDQHDLYAIESYIDGLLGIPRTAHISPFYGKEKPEDDFDLTDEQQSDELLLERLTFSAIKILQKGKRHTCDQYYDDAFGGYDEVQGA